MPSIHSHKSKRYVQVHEKIRLNYPLLVEGDEVAFRGECQVVRNARQRGDRMALSYGKLWLLHDHEP